MGLLVYYYQPIVITILLIMYIIMLNNKYMEKDPLAKLKEQSKSKKKIKKTKKPKQLSEKEIFYNDQEIFKQNLKDEYGIDIDNEEHKSN